MGNEISACLAPDADNAVDDGTFNCSVSWSAVRNSTKISPPENPGLLDHCLLVLPEVR